ncbi:MAG: ABC transporter permease [Micropruina sp.]|nr:ABC transporter permease [Micropruina sp.]
MTGVFRAELVKLRRSAVWAIAPILPLMAVFTGTMNVLGNAGTLDSGWASLTSQVTLFYGLMFFSIGVGLLAATVWRSEHRGSNWNLLVTGTRRPLLLVLAKIAAIAVPVAFMQLVLIAGTLAAGVLVLRLDGPIPWEFAGTCALSVVIAFPLVATQSLLSMLIRTFAAPVAICLAGCVVGLATVMSEALRPLGYLVPQALNTKALSLGSNAISDAGGLGAGDIVPLVGSAVVLTAAVVALTVWLIRTVKLR